MTTSPVVKGPSAPVSWLSDPWPRASTALLIATVGIAPIALLPMASPIYAGIATASPTVYTYTVAIVVAVALMAVRAPRHLLGGVLPWTPLFVWLLAQTVFSWDSSPRLYSGLLHLALGAAAFALGVVAAAPTGDDAPERGAAASVHLVPWLFAAVAWIQLLAVTLALIGLPLRTLTWALAQDANGRATGLTSHPGELSKLLFFCAMFALALPRRTTRERWVAWSTLGATLVGVSLTQSRAPLAGIVAMIAIFVALDFAAGRWQRWHAVALGMTGVLALASIPWMIRRFATDAGDRGHTMRVALETIGQYPVSGVGVNDYVAVVGETDRLTSTGVPVHNVFLLSAAEIGILGALLLWLPMVAVSVRAVRDLRRGSDITVRVLVSALPGIVLMAMTGWGLLQGPYFLILAFVFGYFSGPHPVSMLPPRLRRPWRSRATKARGGHTDGG
jgi:hypothetical protein